MRYVLAKRSKPTKVQREKTRDKNKKKRQKQRERKKKKREKERGDKTFNWKFWEKKASV